MYPGIEIAIAVVLLVVAVVAIIWAVSEATVIALGVFALAAGGAAAFLYIGVTGYHGKFAGKHDAIVRDLTRQGFSVRDSDVYARGGNQLYGTEADLRAGSCVWPFYATKIDGRWRVTLPSRDGNGVEIVTPADVAKLATVCG